MSKTSIITALHLTTLLGMCVYITRIHYKLILVDVACSTRIYKILSCQTKKLQLGIKLIKPIPVPADSILDPTPSAVSGNMTAGKHRSTKKNGLPDFSDNVQPTLTINKSSSRTLDGFICFSPILTTQK